MEHPNKTKIHKTGRYILWAFALAMLLYGGARLYYRATDDFRIANITHPMPYTPEWDIPALSPASQERLDTILSQKFHYIGKGAQSYAFGSDDGKYVIKFFKFKHLKPNWFVDSLPNVYPFGQYRDIQKMRKERKLYGVFNGYRLAYDVHRDESGLIYIHLNPSDTFHKQVTVFDKIGLPRQIDLDATIFVVQEKGRTTRAVVDEALQKGDLATAKARIRQILDLYSKEYAKGIYDKDHGVMHNTGFVGDRPIHLDVGKLVANEEMKMDQVYQPDMVWIAWMFGSWIKTAHPRYKDELWRDIEAKLSETFGKPFTFAESTPPVKKKK